MRPFVAVWCLFILFFSGLPAVAQEETPPAPDECEIGALCTEVGRGVRPGEGTFEVNDPPGDVVTSLLTIGFIALVVGTYFFIALTGRNFAGLFRMFGRRA